MDWASMNVRSSILLLHPFINYMRNTYYTPRYEQVQACDDNTAWICPIDPLVMSLGCVKFKRRKIEIEVEHY